MCTVTYLPIDNERFILTSNRDETPLRKTLLPEVYEENGVRLLYPKDAVAGGTWIGVSDRKRLICLLNGAFEKHEKQPPYKMSRGVIVKKLLSIIDVMSCVDEFDFTEVEPFTIILIDWKEKLQAYELVWDGYKKHFKELPAFPKIWSSAPLYDSSMKHDREIWFKDWLRKNSEINQDSILKFHSRKDLGSKEIAPVMKRPYVETVSISSVIKDKETVSFYYKDVRSGKEYRTLF